MNRPADPARAVVDLGRLSFHELEQLLQVLHGHRGCTTSTFGVVPSRLTGARSRSVS
jgi:hypothetical protein